MPCVWFLEPVLLRQRDCLIIPLQQQLCVLHLQTGRRSVQHQYWFEAAPGNFGFSFILFGKNDGNIRLIDDEITR